MKLLFAVLLAASAIAGCTLFDDDPPSNSCNTDQDCFRAQGEVCNQTKHACEMKTDAGVDAP